MATPTSYLQTLAKDEAIAFVASLEKVKEHLSQELQWMNEQVQQKTGQIQGIETLLSEAIVLGLIDSSAHSAPAPTLAAETHTNGQTAATPDDDASTAESTDSTTAAIAASAAATLPARQKRGSQKTSNVKPPRGAKPSAANKTNTKAEKADPSTTGKSQPGKAAGLQQSLQRQFRDKSLTDSVGEILDRAKKPLGASDVMAELYDGLSNEDYKRAKNSIANLLSVGRTKGRWKSTGRGLYAGNAVATA